MVYDNSVAPRPARGTLHRQHAEERRPKGSPDPLLDQMLVDRYLISKEVGHGSHARVYKAFDIKRGIDVAVKVLRQNPRGQTSFGFMVEALFGQLLSHPNLVRVLEPVGRSGELCFFVMELLSGSDLKHLLRRTGHMEWCAAVDAQINVCRALEHLHSFGFIHGDVKPSNSFQADDGRALLLDLGLMRRSQFLVTGTTFVGSLAFMAPEIFKAQGVTDRRIDIYSAGATLYTLLCGSSPFIVAESGIDKGSVISRLARMHLYDSPESLSSRRPDLNIPPRIEELVMVALEKDPANRFQSAAEMAKALQDALD